MDIDDKLQEILTHTIFFHPTPVWPIMSNVAQVINVRGMRKGHRW